MRPNDLSNPYGADQANSKKIERLLAGVGSSGGGDSSHAGAGDFSIVLGDAAESPADYGVAIGQASYADGTYSTAVGPGAYADSDGAALGNGATASGVQSVAIGRSVQADGLRSVAIGNGAYTATDYEFMLGHSSHNVVVPGSLTVNGTFSNPSARRLKQNINPAPDLPDIFPELVEYEYIDGDGKQRLGYIADDLIGTDAERFVVLDGDGQPAAIDYLGLLVAQVARLSARIAELEKE